MAAARTTAAAVVASIVLALAAATPTNVAAAVAAAAAGGRERALASYSPSTFVYSFNRLFNRCSLRRVVVALCEGKSREQLFIHHD